MTNDKIFDQYREELECLSCIALNQEVPEVYNSYYMVTALLAPGLPMTRDAFMQELARRQIGSRPFFYPLSFLPAYQSLPQSRDALLRNRHSYAITPRGLNLPSGFNMTPDKIHYVCSQIREMLRSLIPSTPPLRAEL